MTRGILWVSSLIARPDRLPLQKWLSWYEDTHVDEVVSLSGVPAATRYEQVEMFPPGTPKPDWLMKSPWLTLYEMADVAFRDSDEFRGLDGQSEPRKELLEGVFKNAGFETRFAEELQWDEGAGVEEGPASLLISATLKPKAGDVEEFDRWYREEHIPLIRAIPGYVRTRRYKIIESTVLHKFERKESFDAPMYLTLHEFEAEAFPFEQLMKVDETEWSKKIVEGLRGLEAGFFRRRRVYGTYLEGKGAKL